MSAVAVGIFCAVIGWYAGRAHEVKRWSELAAESGQTADAAILLATAVVEREQEITVELQGFLDELHELQARIG